MNTNDLIEQNKDLHPKMMPLLMKQKELIDENLNTKDHIPRGLKIAAF